MSAWTSSRSCSPTRKGHINYLETQLNLLKDIGIQNYGQLNAHSADELPSEDVGP